MRVPDIRNLFAELSLTLNTAPLWELGDRQLGVMVIGLLGGTKATGKPQMLNSILAYLADGRSCRLVVLIAGTELAAVINCRIGDSEPVSQLGNVLKERLKPCFPYRNRLRDVMLRWLGMPRVFAKEMDARRLGATLHRLVVSLDHSVNQDILVALCTFVGLALLTMAEFDTDSMTIRTDDARMEGESYGKVVVDIEIVPYPSGVPSPAGRGDG